MHSNAKYAIHALQLNANIISPADSPSSDSHISLCLNPSTLHTLIIKPSCSSLCSSWSSSPSSPSSTSSSPPSSSFFSDSNVRPIGHLQRAPFVTPENHKTLYSRTNTTPKVSPNEQSPLSPPPSSSGLSQPPPWSLLTQFKWAVCINLTNSAWFLSKWTWSVSNLHISSVLVFLLGFSHVEPG